MYSALSIECHGYLAVYIDSDMYSAFFIDCLWVGVWLAFHFSSRKVVFYGETQNSYNENDNTFVYFVFRLIWRSIQQTGSIPKGTERFSNMFFFKYNIMSRKLFTNKTMKKYYPSLYPTFDTQIIISLWVVLITYVLYITLNLNLHKQVWLTFLIFLEIYRKG